MIKFSDEELQKLVDMIQKKEALMALVNRYEEKEEITLPPPPAPKKITDSPITDHVAKNKPVTAKDLKDLKMEYFKALREQRIGDGEKKGGDKEAKTERFVEKANSVVGDDVSST